MWSRKITYAYKQKISFLYTQILTAILLKKHDGEVEYFIFPGIYYLIHKYPQPKILRLIINKKKIILSLYDIFFLYKKVSIN